jgi:hypothetical protein
MYTVGLFVSVMSTAALNAASSATGPPCSESTCHFAYQHRQESSASLADPDLIHAAILLAETL